MGKLLMNFKDSIDKLCKQWRGRLTPAAHIPVFFYVFMIGIVVYSDYEYNYNVDEEINLQHAMLLVFVQSK